FLSAELASIFWKDKSLRKRKKHKEELDRLCEKILERKLGLVAKPFLWIIPSSTDSAADAPITAAYPCGVILARPRGPNSTFPREFELLVWIRGSYRNLGLARECVDEPLSVIWQTLRNERRDESSGRVKHEFTVR